MSKRNHIVFSACIGILSGVISFLSLSFGESIVTFILPAFVFPLFIGFYYLRLARTVHFLKIVWFTLFSIIGSVAAIVCGYAVWAFLQATYGQYTNQVMLLMAGWGFFTVGIGVTFSFLVSFSSFITKLGVKSFLLLTLLGALLSLTLFSGVFIRLNQDAFLSLFIFWQTGMAIGLALATNPTKKKGNTTRTR